MVYFLVLAKRKDSLLAFDSIIVVNYGALLICRLRPLPVVEILVPLHLRQSTIIPSVLDLVRVCILSGNFSSSFS